MKVIVKSEYSISTDKVYTETLDLDFKEYLEEYFEGATNITKSSLRSCIESYINGIDEYLVYPEDDEKDIEGLLYSAVNIEEIVEAYKYLITDSVCKHENENGKYCSKCGIKLK